VQLIARDGHEAEEVEGGIGDVTKRREHQGDEGSAKALSHLRVVLALLAVDALDDLGDLLTAATGLMIVWSVRRRLAVASNTSRSGWVRRLGLRCCTATSVDDAPLLQMHSPT
jgi:hypothetical protein